MPLEMSVEEAAKMIISFGLVTPEGLARADVPEHIKEKAAQLDKKS